MNGSAVYGPFGFGSGGGSAIGGGTGSSGGVGGAVGGSLFISMCVITIGLAITTRVPLGAAADAFSTIVQ